MFCRFNIYVLWEITKLFVIALVAFTALFMLVGAGKELRNQGLDFQSIVLLFPYLLPFALQFSLPATLLFAVCSVFGRISADNEILSVTAAGVPPMRIIAPTLIASFMLSLFAVWTIDIAVSWGQPGINRVIMHSIEKVAYGWLSTQGSYSSASGLSIYVSGIGEDGREMISPVITTSPAGDEQPISITARSARLVLDPEREVLCIELQDSEFEANGLKTEVPGPYRHEISLGEMTGRELEDMHPSEIPMREIAPRIRAEHSRVKNTEEILAARTAMSLAVGRSHILNGKPAHQSLAEIRGARSHTRRLKLEPWRRWAAGFSCFFFVWVGIPLSIWMRSADHWTSFGVCFLPILLIYYPVFAMGLDYAKEGVWPPAAVWLGNAVLLLVGGFWLRKVYRG